VLEIKNDSAESLSAQSRTHYSSRTYYVTKSV
jgi:hypothetical protein